MSGVDRHAMVETLTRRLDSALRVHADPATKDWWERYLKHEATFRGVKMADTRRTVRELVDQERLDTADPDLMLLIAHRWFAQAHSEDKLGAVLLLAEHGLHALTLAHIESLARPLHDGSIHDWNVCDWYCVKVLGPFVAAGDDTAARARAVADWAQVEDLWQRRAAVVTFVNHAATSPEAFNGFTDFMLDTCEAIVGDQRRWVQTGIGWLLRELSRREPEAVVRFVADHAELSTEARKNATKYVSAR